MIRKLFRDSIISVFAVFTALGFSGNAQAQNAYAKQQLNQTNAGGFFRSVNGQTDLVPPSPDPTQKIFVTKEMWLLDELGNWVEMGSVKGYTAADGISSTTAWAGEYYARQKVVSGVTTYLRRYIGTTGSTGAKSFQINIGTGSGALVNWDFYLNGTYLGSFDSPKSSFPYMQVGIESNNGCSNYTSGTYADSLYYYTTGTTKSWQQWNTTPVDGDNKKIAAWDSVYNSTAQKITFLSGAKPAGCP
ncbi:MAG: hypothetical protein LH702_24305 [Phormidesmis sp. CAN_BIN44]|nr:hypothetical protein [Phormidesmis sp. CAN_BIN44]